MKCIKIMGVGLNVENVVICEKDAEFMLEGNSFCYEHGKEILVQIGQTVAMQQMQEKIQLPMPNPKQVKKPSLVLPK